jgi:hypothetical protein
MTSSTRGVRQAPGMAAIAAPCRSTLQIGDGFDAALRIAVLEDSSLVQAVGPHSALRRRNAVLSRSLWPSQASR